ncbi:YeeE/YedE thiosulfate transporter family protein [Geobacter sp. DSM 9736]|uniref:YeeE/YedE thiosulfate transporter family protein n=1 Tax=Geobacter sp. DSM 9736 TaxID=1277350 RepID=UPI000B505ECE|nr:YeeE/YedE thiosulfate transporter family protein [Geobacter sp. DSM 9736]SNB46905.1 hypothetical protein SAMN06269301_2377 [Geobacter sp. DSM 9736]
MNVLRLKSWSPYLVGAAIGVLSWFAFASADRQIGITTAFEYSAALVQKAAAPQIAEQNTYYAEKANENKSPKIDWEWMLVVGVFIGAFVSSKLSGDRPGEKVPQLWRWRFGANPAARYTGAFAGGLIMMFGARVAQGCTSGHAISGFLQLALSSWIFAPVMFTAAVATAFLLYGREGRNHVG